MAYGRRDLGASVAALAAFVLVLVGLMSSPADAQTSDLSITKEGPATVEPGTEFEYIITVTNNEDEDNTDAPAAVTVTDELPEGVEFVEAEGATCTAADTDADGRDDVTCQLTGLEEGDSATITLTVSAPATAGNITNRASADDLADPDDPVNSNEVTTRVAPDLEINKLDDPDPVSDPQDLLLYTLRVQNQGDSVVSGIGVTDDLPLSRLDFVTVESSDFDCEFTAGAVQCTGGTLGPGEIGTVEIVVEPEVVGTIRNRGDVFVEGLDEPVDTDIEETVVQERAVSDDDNDDDDNNDDGADDDADADAEPSDGNVVAETADAADADDAAAEAAAADATGESAEEICSSSERVRIRSALVQGSFPYLIEGDDQYEDGDDQNGYYYEYQYDIGFEDFEYLEEDFDSQFIIDCVGRRGSGVLDTVAVDNLPETGGALPVVPLVGFVVVGVGLIVVRGLRERP